MCDDLYFVDLEVIYSVLC